jgi:squalene cyclase
MPMFRATLALTLMAASLAFAAVAGAQAVPDRATAARRAVGYLAQEVPRWRREHPCYSCHNNGDGARALIAASRRGLIDLRQIDDAIGWLRTPERWSLNSEAGGVKDLPLSRIQFASALQALRAAGGVDQAAVDRAASLVMADQRSDGSWPISVASHVGTPTGYGTPLATVVARNVLRGAATDAARAAVRRIDAWFRGFAPQAVLEASSVLLGLEAATDDGATAARPKALAIMKQGQSRDGGWGPYTSSPSESFDTAVAVLALLSFRDNAALAEPVFSQAEWRAAIDRGRDYLLSQQNDDGSWPETTRPSQQESYSQRISTTAWALIALIAE